jgi:cellulose synthase/poly-beta-1,6-N-acetylglucosamine synthase-like glycosyltransferase
MPKAGKSTEVMIVTCYSLFALGGLFLFFTLYLWFLALASSLPERRRNQSSFPEKNIAIVVPAHNEAKVIERTISSLKRLDYPIERYQIIVVADNCEDDTARIARENGVGCLERFDDERKGKGYALDWALTKLKEDDFDAFVIIDADTVVDRDFLKAMSRRLNEGKQAIQGYYDVLNPAQSPMASLSYLGFVISRNLRYKGRSRLGWSCNLLGNGMCFTTEVIKRYGWPAKSIVEDIEFEMMLVLDGIPVAFAPEARIYAEIPGTFQDSTVQRTRWDLGKFRVRNEYLFRLIQTGFRKRSLGCLDSALELIIPPYSLYWVLLFASYAIVFGLSWGRFPSLLAMWSLILLASFLYALLGLAIARAGWRVYKNLFFVPFFLAWRVGILLKGYFSGAAKQWVKTEREPQRP